MASVLATGASGSDILSTAMPKAARDGSGRDWTGLEENARERKLTVGRPAISPRRAGRSSTAQSHGDLWIGHPSEEQVATRLKPDAKYVRSNTTDP
jgi:hypothetical protein